MCVSWNPSLTASQTAVGASLNASVQALSNYSNTANYFTTFRHLYQSE